MKPAGVPIPERMRHLPRDGRGYPIPATVCRHSTGTAHFTINDEHKRQAIIGRDCCPICGGKLLRARKFVAGPPSAFHECGQISRVSQRSTHGWRTGWIFLLLS